MVVLMGLAVIECSGSSGSGNGNSCGIFNRTSTTGKTT